MYVGFTQILAGKTCIKLKTYICYDHVMDKRHQNGWTSKMIATKHKHRMRQNSKKLKVEIFKGRALRAPD